MASAACMQLPPAEAEYKPQGSYTTMAGLHTYVTGAAGSPWRAIIDIYDIFGMAPQTLQGADRLAGHLEGAVVLVPDFFGGHAADAGWFPPDTEEKKAAVPRWMAEHGNLSEGSANYSALRAVRKAVGEKWPGVEERVAVFGLCWGGKLGIQACGKDNEGAGRRFAAGGTAHPGRLTVEDAEALTAPWICLASGGEPEDMVAKYKEMLAGPGKTGEVETYADMAHGWMGARADLSVERNLAEFERGYKQAAEFFSRFI